MDSPSVEGARMIGPDELVLELGEVCIETTGQQVHRRLMAGLLEDQLEGPLIEGAVELLSRFLAQEDFAAIRVADPELAGEHRVDVRVFWDAAGRVRWEKLPAQTGARP